jgi:hypothetical protein
MSARRCLSSTRLVEIGDIFAVPARAHADADRQEFSRARPGMDLGVVDHLNRRTRRPAAGPAQWRANWAIRPGCSRSGSCAETATSPRPGAQRRPGVDRIDLGDAVAELQARYCRAIVLHAHPRSQRARLDRQRARDDRGGDAGNAAHRIAVGTCPCPSRSGAHSAAESAPWVLRPSTATSTPAAIAGIGQHLVAGRKLGQHDLACLDIGGDLDPPAVFASGTASGRLHRRAIAFAVARWP